MHFFPWTQPYEYKVGYKSHLFSFWSNETAIRIKIPESPREPFHNLHDDVEEKVSSPSNSQLLRFGMRRLVY